MNEIITAIFIAIGIYSCAYIAGRGFAAGSRTRDPHKPIFTFYPIDAFYGITIFDGDVKLQSSTSKFKTLRICGWWTVIFNYGKVSP